MSPPGTVFTGLKPATLSPPAEVASAAAGAVAALTSGLMAGDDEAYRALHAAYAGRLRRYLLVVCRGDEAAAQEALQQTLLRVARHARRFDHEDDLWRWLAALARSAAVDAARREHRHTAALRRYLDWLLPPPTEPAGPDPLDLLDELLAAGLEALPETDRELLLSRYRAGRPVNELAAAAGISPKAMESRLARLRAQLRTRLLDQLAHEKPA